MGRWRRTEVDRSPERERLEEPTPAVTPRPPDGGGPEGSGHPLVERLNRMRWPDVPEETIDRGFREFSRLVAEAKKNGRTDPGLAHGGRVASDREGSS